MLRDGLGRCSRVFPNVSLSDLGGAGWIRSVVKLFRRFAPVPTIISGERFLDETGRFRAPFPLILEGKWSGGGFPCFWRILEVLDCVKLYGARTLAPAIFPGKLPGELIKR